MFYPRLDQGEVDVHIGCITLPVRDVLLVHRPSGVPFTRGPYNTKNMRPVRRLKPLGLRISFSKLHSHVCICAPVCMWDQEVTSFWMFDALKMSCLLCFADSAMAGFTKSGLLLILEVTCAPPLKLKMSGMPETAVCGGDLSAAP